MKPLRALVVPAFGLIALVSACSRGDSATEASPAPSVSTGSTAASSSSSPPATSSPGTTSPATSAPATAAPATTVPVGTTTPSAEPPPPTSSAPVSRQVLVQWGNTPIAVWDGSWQFPNWDEAGTPEFSVPSIPAIGTGLSVAAPATGGMYGPAEEFCYGFQLGYPVEFDDLVAEGDVLNVDADWNVQPRPVEYARGPIADLQAAGEALVDPVRGDPGQGVVREVARADLDGDGDVEVLFTFEHQTPNDSFGTAGDFTLLVARYPGADGSITDQVIWSFYEEDPVAAPNPSGGWLIAVADFNGDGVMEVVTGHTYWESTVASVFALSGGRLTEVAGGGCGT